MEEGREPLHEHQDTDGEGRPHSKYQVQHDTTNDGGLMVGSVQYNSLIIYIFFFLRSSVISNTELND